MSDVVWGEPIEVNGVKPDWLAIGDEGMFENTPNDWLGPDRLLSYSWGVDDNGDKGCPISIRLRADHPQYLAQPSPVDTVTVRMMSDVDAVKLFHGPEGKGDIGAGRFVNIMRHLGLILPPPNRAERIAKSTSLPLSDVERVLAAVEEGE